jgi:hypothetical protein
LNDVAPRWQRPDHERVHDPQWTLRKARRRNRLAWHGNLRLAAPHDGLKRRLFDHFLVRIELRSDDNRTRLLDGTAHDDRFARSVLRVTGERT